LGQVSDGDQGWRKIWQWLTSPTKEEAGEESLAKKEEHPKK
jgi:hypothetical protein